MDWASFEFKYILDFQGTLVSPHIISIEAYKEAALNLVLPPEWREQLDKLNCVRAIYGTTALEGNPLSEAEVSHQIDLVDRPLADVEKKATKEQLQIRNASAAQAWVKRRFYPGSDPLALPDILLIHKMTTGQSDELNNDPGSLRGHNVKVRSEDMGGVHRGAPYEELHSLMHKYIDFVNSRQLVETHPVIRALLAHYFLVTIHPFGDGNGRVSRLVEAGILFQGGYNVHGFYGLSNYFYRNERDYKTLLQKCRERQPFDVTPFVIFGLKGFAAELKGINTFIKTKLNRVVYRDMLVRAYRKRTGARRRLLNQREYDLLGFLLTETEPTDPFSDSPSRRITLAELSKAPYILAAYGKVTPRTFFRELFRLGQLGFIGFTKDEPTNEWIIELNFEAIGRY